MTRKERDPLAPIEFVVSAILVVLVTLTLAFAGLAAYGLASSGESGVTVAGFGGDYACLDDVTNVTIFVSGQEPSQGIAGLDRDRATDNARAFSVCIEDPTATERILGSVDPMLSFVAVLVALLLVRRAVRTARADGLFTPAAASRVRTLGWFMLITSIVVPIVGCASTTWVMSGLVSEQDWSWAYTVPGVLFNASFSPLAIVVAAGLITFARVLERAVPLQEEVDATV